MGLYHVQLPADAQFTLVDGKNSAIIVADSTADAKQVLKAYMSIPSDAAWAAATVTALTEGTDLENWRAKLIIKDTNGDIVETVEVTAASGDDFDDIGGDLVTALNATDTIAGAAYSTPNLKIAETTDGIGDHTVELYFLPPTTWDDPTINLASLYGTLVHEGASGDALTVVLNDIVLPAVKYQMKA
jgi:hypothetical protein